MKKPKVAFICVHNSCRSQIAEALGRHLAGDVFESYDYNGMEGYVDAEFLGDYPAPQPAPEVDTVVYPRVDRHLANTEHNKKKPDRYDFDYRSGF